MHALSGISEFIVGEVRTFSGGILSDLAISLASL
jgi:hypothetical protein